ncbi:hypothetical protein Scep_022028 [Stephania cephalantha]|uniref:Uncharacterized protein n=1 Tax=Stephania cephalantha TaxID=152367 RepID=A0AAP0F5D9_9MAGN
MRILHVARNLLSRYVCYIVGGIGMRNLFTTNATNASASQPLPAMPSMMDFSQPIPRISPKARAKIPVVRRRGGGRGGVIERGGIIGRGG